MTDTEARSLANAIKHAEATGQPVQFAHATIMPTRPIPPMPESLKKQLREFLAQQ